ncbi:hypothetical protein IAT40_007617 [Kwoniella sp. CBS 6097]
MASILRTTISRSVSVAQPLPLVQRSFSTVFRSQPIASTSTSRVAASTIAPLACAYYRSSRSATPLPSSSRRWNSSSSGPDSSSSSSSSGASASSSASAPENPAIEAPAEGYKPQKIAQIEPRLQMTFTCTANDCGHRSTHEFSKRAYTKGLVLVQCPECKSRHLIADHIGWFKESTEEGKLKTVEDLLAAKGEKIRKGRVNFDGDIEYEGDD